MQDGAGCAWLGRARLGEQGQGERKYRCALQNGHHVPNPATLQVIRFALPEAAGVRFTDDGESCHRGKANPMGDELAELRRRVSLIEQDVEGERGVSRHILRKVTENETALLDLRADMAGLRKDLSERLTSLENHFVTLRADLPGILASAVADALREDREKRK